MNKKERVEIERTAWGFITDFTHWIAEGDLREAINSLDTQKMILEKALRRSEGK